MKVLEKTGAEQFMGSISLKQHEMEIWYFSTQLKELKHLKVISHSLSKESPHQTSGVPTTRLYCVGIFVASRRTRSLCCTFVVSSFMLFLALGTVCSFGDQHTFGTDWCCPVISSAANSKPGSPPGLASFRTTSLLFSSCAIQRFGARARV